MLSQNDSIHIDNKLKIDGLEYIFIEYHVSTLINQTVLERSYEKETTFTSEFVLQNRH